MKKFCFLFLLSTLFLFVPSVYAEDVELFNMDFVRETGAPVTETYNFSGVIGSATINIYNGAQNDYETGERVSASVISVNRIDVFGTAEFNQNVTSLTKQIILNEGYNSNNISVQLMGKPGGKIRIEIIQNAQEAKVILTGQEWASKICKEKFDQLGDTEEARIESVALINTLPGVQESGISEDGTIWIKYYYEIEGLILLNPEGSLGGVTITKEINNQIILTSSSFSESDVLIWNPFNLAPVDSLKEIFNNSECHNFLEVKHLKGEECSVQSVKDDFTKYGTIIIFTHGGLDSEGNESFTTGQEAIEEKLQENIEESALGKIDVHITNSIFNPLDDETRTYWAITPAFISNISGNFNDTIVFNGSCNSLKNGKMSSAFQSKGVRTYFGYTTYSEADIAGQAAINLFENLVENQETAIDAFYAVPEMWRCPLLFSCLGIDGDLDFEYSCNSSEPAAERWLKTYSNNYGIDCSSIIQTPDGGFILSGSGFDINTHRNGGILLKLDANGEKQWVKIYGTNTTNFWVARSLIVTDSGDYIIAGGFPGINSGIITKIDVSGNILWHKKYPEISSFIDIKATTDSCYIANGYYNYNGNYYTVMKFDSSFNVVWRTEVEAASSFSPYKNSFCETEDGGFVFAAGAYRGAYPWVIKLNNEGNIEWQKQYYIDILNDGQPDYYQASALKIQPSPVGGFCVSGDLHTNFAGSYHSIIFQIDNSGTPIWGKIYSMDSESVIVTNDLIKNGGSGFVIGGSAYLKNNPRASYPWLMGLDLNGNINWQKRYGYLSTYDTYLRGIESGPNEDILAFGTMFSYYDISSSDISQSYDLLFMNLESLTGETNSDCDFITDMPIVSENIGIETEDTNEEAVRTIYEPVNVGDIFSEIEESVSVTSICSDSPL